MAFENYGPAYVIDQRAALDPSGNIVPRGITSRGRRAWATVREPTGPGTSSRVRCWDSRRRTSRLDHPRHRRARSTTTATACRPTSPAVTGTVQSGRVLTHAVESRFFTGPLRSPARLQNTFAHESFMDELAARVKADPVEYRLRHLRDARLKEVLSRPQRRRRTGRRVRRPSPGIAKPASPADAARRACSTKATTATPRWSPRSK